MKAIWSLTVDELEDIQNICRKVGIKPGESMEPVLIEYMKAKGKKPIGHTELNKEELLTDVIKKSKRGVLQSNVDKDGKTSYTIIKKRGEDNVS